MTNKTFKEEVLKEFDDKLCVINSSGYNELSIFMTRLSEDTDYTKSELVFVAEEIKKFIESSLDLYKQKILEALPKDEQPECGGLINFASNIRPEGSETDKMIDSFNYGFRLGYKAHTDEVKQIIENI